MTSSQQCCKELKFNYSQQCGGKCESIHCFSIFNSSQHCGQHCGQHCCQQCCKCESPRRNPIFLSSQHCWPQCWPQCCQHCWPQCCKCESTISSLYHCMIVCMTIVCSLSVLKNATMYYNNQS